MAMHGLPPSPDEVVGCFVDDEFGRVEVDAIWSLLSMEIGAAETLNPARVLPTDGAN